MSWLRQLRGQATQTRLGLLQHERYLWAFLLFNRDSMKANQKLMGLLRRIQDFRLSIYLYRFSPRPGGSCQTSRTVLLKAGWFDVRRYKLFRILP